MARAKVVKLESQPQKVFWGESYSSLLLGMVVVAGIGLIIFSLLGNRGGPKQTSSVKDKETTEEQKRDEKVSVSPKTYKVVAGDNLWSIAEKQYKSGYNWVDIAKANNLANPSLIHAGVKITIPDVKLKIITMVQQKVSEIPATNAIKGSSYTVVSGDNLWDIAVRSYGDGYRFVEIVRANNLSNPDLIFVGNKLKIPR